MRTNSEISQWGNGLAVRLNRSVIDAANLTKGCKVQIEVDKTGVHIRPIKVKKTRLRLPFSEASLLAKITPELAHADELAQPLSGEVGD